MCLKNDVNTNFTRMKRPRSRHGRMRFAQCGASLSNILSLHKASDKLVIIYRRKSSAID